MREDATISVDNIAQPSRVKFVRRGGEQEILHYVGQRVIGASAWARSAPETVAVHAAHTGPLVIEGEPGTGKEFVARLIHDCGPHVHRPFVVIESSSLDERVLQSILFDAPDTLPIATRNLQREYAEQARGGTIYVSDVSTLSPEFCRRLARSVQHPELEHSRKQSLQGRNIRLAFGACYGISPELSGRPPRGAAWRALRIPPLRERAEDIGPLAEYFATQISHRLGKEPRVISAAALDTLAAYAWPGNIGELKRVVDGMVRRAGPPTLDVTLLPAHMLGRAAESGDPLRDGINLHDEVERFERSLLNAALERCGGVQTKAAQLLGMKVSTLNSKLSAYNIDASVFKLRRPA
jgi:DNA-binding NtrC family response regulator